VKQDIKTKQNRGNEESLEAPQETCDLGRRRWKVQRVGLTVGLDVGDKISHYCVLNEEAEVVERGKLKTTPAALQPWLEALPAGTRVVLETGTHSSWISRLIERAGQEALVAQPRKIPQIYRSKRKNDRRDAEKLARTGRLDPNSMGPIRHRSAEQQADLAVIQARDALVQVRTQLINTVRGLVKGTGERLRGCSAPSFARQAEAQIPQRLRGALLPLVSQIGSLSEQIERYDAEVEKLAQKKYPETELLRQVSGVGPVTSLAFVLTVGDRWRFRHSRDVGPFLGLVPAQDESGESSPQLGISKAGNPYLRRLLVGSANYILGPFGPDCELRRWGMKRSERGDKNARKRAKVGVARRLAVLLHKLWVSGEVYEPLPEKRAAA
jgi:transposase